MSDPWNDILTAKDRQNILRAKMLKRKREREGFVAQIIGNSITERASAPNLNQPSKSDDSVLTEAFIGHGSTRTGLFAETSVDVSLPDIGLDKASTLVTDVSTVVIDPEIEKKVLLVLCDISLDIPCEMSIIAHHTSRSVGRPVELFVVETLLKQFSADSLISVSVKEVDGKSVLLVMSLDIARLESISGERMRKSILERDVLENTVQAGTPAKVSKCDVELDIESLLSMQSTKEREEKKANREVELLLRAPTAKEQYLNHKFRTPGGAQLREFCSNKTRDECRRMTPSPTPCNKLHFIRIIQKHTDESLGDCSFLNTCFHVETCKFVHYQVEVVQPSNDVSMATRKQLSSASDTHGDIAIRMFPPQYVQCDLRTFDMSVLGKCAVVMADPPWDIHMELPYGTMADDEMRRLDIPSLQDDGFIFLWVTGRAMELGRECLEQWGYRRCDEIVWVKTNQLQRIIRTGRTGHWLNHGKEHCLVGVKGNPKNVNRGLDCDVIVAEVRATSHKPDEIYGIIERLSPGTRKVELFGRPHNIQPNWITLGNQLEGVCLKDPDIVRMFRDKYPDSNCMVPPASKA